MADEDGRRGEGFRKIILHRQQKAYQAQEHLKMHEPTVPDEVKREAAIDFDNFRDVLLSYREENALQVAWEERDVNVDILEALLSETTVKQEPLPRRGSPTQPKVVLKVADFPAWKLRRIARELHDIAKELGFVAPAHEETEIATDAPQVLPDHIVESAPAFREDRPEAEARTDGGDAE